jgi:ribosomal protein L33
MIKKKGKNTTLVTPLKGTKYLYYTKVNQKTRKGLDKIKVKKYNPITRKREIFSQ